MKKVGFTTSIPVEVIYCAGFKPVDLNNIFITCENSYKLVEKAENEGFPRNTCAWIKGIYSSILSQKDIDTIVGVIEGDCSNTRALLEVLDLKGIKCIPFSYSSSRDYNLIAEEISKLCSFFNVSIKDCIPVKRDIDKVRKKLQYLDQLTWKGNKATGFENHLWQVSSSDFNGDYKSFEILLDQKIAEIESRKEKSEKVRLGYIGVPPIISDLYEYIETLEGRVVFNEVQRQFTMADGIGNDDIVEVYRGFTYPYTIKGRLEDINTQIIKRNIHGIVHYTQSFCFRAIEDIVIREDLKIPVLTLEGDRPGELDSRTKLRIESFIDMLK